MTPHEFLKYTPATNCGECGHPACLAFAVAVTMGGLDPTTCPYLDPSSLPEEFRAAAGDRGGLERVEKGQDERDMALVTHLKSKVRDLDFSTLAERLGASWDATRPDSLVFDYLGRRVELGVDRVLMDGDELVDPRDQILLYNYVAYGGGRKPDNTWIGLESLPNTISKVRTLATYCENRLADRFAGRPGDLARICSLLGGQPGEGEQSGSVNMVILVLPHVPHYLLFWDEEPEDGFEAKVKVLFDHHVLDFLDVESLVFAAERLADRIAELDSGQNRAAAG
ncbi:hypothetical protein GF1_22340 [Desulfolithobacter dissulfuricans]|uniref:4Fe-4S domain-containing protein n=1 Tax=Desulfolithobacter dissulfuricans TaxID=2795293 RepID=A0A915U1Z9_9BACT|nr:DUF3786 domain-containing protein [Desulfolithobacter dissulfuricans]BCO09858.1 hypothetical protein GF1_22340 [Desulfolithobacter dissulfuricans]